VTGDKTLKYQLLEGQEKKNKFDALSKHWAMSEDGNFLYFDLKLKNFIQAVELIQALTPLVESHNHHPDFSFGYGYLKGALQTHTKKTLTTIDFILAEEMDGVFKGY
jgi:4a-hydroxytetrahydrobiopterin dehydratase